METLLEPRAINLLEALYIFDDIYNLLKGEYTFRGLFRVQDSVPFKRFFVCLQASCGKT